MKILFTKPKTLSLLTMICLLWACNKSELVTPPATAQSGSVDEQQTDEVITAALAPGIYKITKFIDNGDNETPEFRGYTFNFQADGDLIAKTNEGDRVRGTWRINKTKTRMVIEISGKDALDGIADDDWRVVSLTSDEIILRTPDPDRVVFTKIK